MESTNIGMGTAAYMQLTIKQQRYYRAAIKTLASTKREHWLGLWERFLTLQVISKLQEVTPALPPPASSFDEWDKYLSRRWTQFDQA